MDIAKFDNQILLCVAMGIVAFFFLSVYREGTVVTFHVQVGVDMARGDCITDEVVFINSPRFVADYRLIRAHMKDDGGVGCQCFRRQAYIETGIAFKILLFQTHGKLVSFDGAEERYFVPLIHISGSVSYSGIEMEMFHVLVAVDIDRIQYHAAGVEPAHVSVHCEYGIFGCKEIERAYRHFG